MFPGGFNQKMTLKIERNIFLLQMKMINKEKKEKGEGERKTERDDCISSSCHSPAAGFRFPVFFPYHPRISIQSDHLVQHIPDVQLDCLYVERSNGIRKNRVFFFSLVFKVLVSPFSY